MILRYCSSPLTSPAIFQALAPFKIHQDCNISNLNDGLPPSVMMLTFCGMDLVMLQPCLKQCQSYKLAALRAPYCGPTCIWHY